MRRSAEKSLSSIAAFDEKQFYLDEFRNRTLALSVSVAELVHESNYAQLAAVVRELLVNGSRLLVLLGVPDPQGAEHVLRRVQRRLGSLVAPPRARPLRLSAAAFAQPESAAALLKTAWEALRRRPLFVGVTAGAGKAEATTFAQQIAAGLRVYKLVVVDGEGGIVGSDGKPLSFMDEATLSALLRAGEAEWAGLAGRRLTLQAIRAALLGGVGSVNLCTLSGTARELFTYEGSGTLFTLADYCNVQKLGIDDFEEVERLIARGQREGLLKLRSADEIAGLLLHAYGATIGARHLAGICALTTEPYRADAAGEITGLYTITRFKGEGVGGRLMARLVADARAGGLAYVFACTTEERAQAFFERHRFRRVGHDQVPAAKWVGYDPRRKTQVAAYRLDLANARRTVPATGEPSDPRSLRPSAR